MKKLDKLIIILGIIITLILVVSDMSQATSTETIWSFSEKSEEFKKWENLSDEEKENTIQPVYSGNSLKESVKRSTYNKIISTKLGNSLESSYRITDITVKNQQHTNLCWAFAFSSVLESSGKGKIYSPAYLDYMVCKNFNKIQGDGGNHYIALAAATSGAYPVLEEDMPFSSVYDTSKNSSSTYYLTPIDQLTDDTLNKTVDARIVHSTEFSSIYKKIGDDNNIIYTDGQKEYTTDNDNNGIPDEVESIRELIKQHIKEHGAISASIYIDYTDTFLNASTGALNCNDSSKAINHSTTIIGWDDNYSVDNFNDSVKPSSPGAYIALNSYGEDSYIYISYEDLIVEEMMMGIEELEEYDKEDEIPYNNIYQYDELGVSVSLDTVVTMPMTANVFTRDSSKGEYLNEIGIYLLSTEGIQVFVNPTDDDKTKLTQVAIETENITPGYHIIKLANPIKLTGEKFVVAVKYINNGDGAGIPLESNLKESGFTETSNYFDTAKSNENESFISLDNGQTWRDMYNYEINSTITLKNTNACIKAYTTETTAIDDTSDEKDDPVVDDTPDEKEEPVTDNTPDEKDAPVVDDTSDEKDAPVTDDTPEVIEVTGVTLNKNTLSMEVGDIGNLVATITPANATNKDVIWSSSNTDIATISDTGIINALKEGTTIITVTTQNGNFTDTCEITVTQAIDTDDDIYQDNEQYNNKDSNSTVNGKIDNNDTKQIEQAAVLPYTGLRRTIVGIVIITVALIILIISYVRYKKLNI